MLIRPLNLSSEEMMDHAMAFDQFRRAYRKYEAMENNKVILSKKMAMGKELGREVNEVREKVNRLKTRLEELKRVNVVNSIVDGVEKESS